MRLSRLFLIGLGAAFLAAALLNLQVKGVDLNVIGASFPAEQDTVRFQHYLNGVLQGTEKTKTNVSSWDTTIADVAVGEHRIIYWMVENAGDVPLPWHWTFMVEPDSVPIPGAQVTAIAQEASDSTLVDSTHYQGAASGLSAAEILDSLLDRGIGAFPDAWWHNIALRADSGAIGSSVWSSGDRDSILNALTSASLQQKIWIDATTKELTALGFTLGTADFATDAFSDVLFGETFWAEIAARADSGLWQSVLTALVAKHDTLRILLTLHPCAKYYADTSSNIDLMIYVDTCTGDTLGYTTYFHLNGSPGDRPDSGGFIPEAPL